ncbi:4471_t:CDS:2 [Diversispora eburnea]|uniref:4471_t:CDS:1 n=1 Tax=Diversispora eburnea TaxID=1213867 RepID=A0A9N9CC46_9GLOM|nr:4471_t:CDS:2 [Diversispora eburnea]
MSNTVEQGHTFETRVIQMLNWLGMWANHSGQLISCINGNLKYDPINKPCALALALALMVVNTKLTFPLGTLLNTRINMDTPDPVPLNLLITAIKSVIYYYDCCSSITYGAKSVDQTCDVPATVDGWFVNVLVAMGRSKW